MIKSIIYFIEIQTQGNILIRLLKAVNQPAYIQKSTLFPEKHKVVTQKSEMKEILNDTKQSQQSNKAMHQIDASQYMEQQLKYSIHYYKK